MLFQTFFSGISCANIVLPAVRAVPRCEHRLSRRIRVRTRQDTTVVPLSLTYGSLAWCLMEKSEQHECTLKQSANQELGAIA